MKFKVGQKVKVKNFYDIAGTFEGDHRTHNLVFTKQMLDLCGETLTITNIRKSSICTELVADVRETRHVFVEEWLEPVYEKHNVTLADIYKEDASYASYIAHDLCDSYNIITIGFEDELDEMGIKYTDELAERITDVYEDRLLDLEEWHDVLIQTIKEFLTEEDDEI